MGKPAAPAKHAQPRPATHVIATWAAFVCAGFCFATAGYLLTTVPSWRAIYESMGVALPLVIELQQPFPVGVPVFLILVGAGFLTLARVPAPEHPVLRAACGLSYPAAVFAVLFSLLMVFCNLLAFMEMSRTLAYEDDGTQVLTNPPMPLPPPPPMPQKPEAQLPQTGALPPPSATPAPSSRQGLLAWQVDPIRTSFERDDWIKIKSIQGPLNDGLVHHGRYQISGRYFLGSRKHARLALQLTNGSIDHFSNHPIKVESGVEGSFTFTFSVEATGDPHVYFYPSDGGASFGDLYFEAVERLRYAAPNTVEALKLHAESERLEIHNGPQGFAIALDKALRSGKKILVFCLGEPGELLRDPRVFQRIHQGYVVAVLDSRIAADQELIRRRFGLKAMATTYVLAPGGAKLGGMMFESLDVEEVLTFFDVVEGKQVPIEQAPKIDGEGKQAEAAKGPRVDLPGVEVTLRDLVAAIGMQVGQTIHVDPVIGETRLTVDLKGVGWRQALEAVARGARCEVQEKGKVLVLTRQRDRGPADYEHGGGIVVLRTGQVFVGWVTSDDERVWVRWPYKGQTEEGSTSFKRGKVRWFSDQTDRLTDEYWAKHPTEPLKAIAAVPGAIKKAGETAAQRARAKELLKQAMAALQRGDVQAAEKAMAQAAWNDPEAASVWLVIGNSRLARRDLAGASNAYGQVIDLDRYSVPAYMGRSRARLEMKDFDGALADAERAVMLGRDKAEPEALLLRGRALEALGKTKAALHAYRLAEQAAFTQNKGEWIGEAQEGQKRLGGKK